MHFFIEPFIYMEHTKTLASIFCNNFLNDFFSRSDVLTTNTVLFCALLLLFFKMLPLVLLPAALAYHGDEWVSTVQTSQAQMFLMYHFMEFVEIEL